MTNKKTQRFLLSSHITHIFEVVELKRMRVKQYERAQLIQVYIVIYSSDIMSPEIHKIGILIGCLYFTIQISIFMAAISHVCF